MVEFILGLLIGIIIGFLFGIWAIAYLIMVTYLKDPEEFNRQVDKLKRKLEELSK